MKSDNKQIFIKTDFGCVFFLNGAFAESANGFNYPADTPIYITVMPLEAHLLPYTIKMLEATALNNQNLVASFLFEDKIFIKMMPRYNYIYENSGAIKAGATASASVAEKLFWAVKQQDFVLAKSLCTEGLLNTIDEGGLSAFFEPFTAILKDEFGIEKLEKDILNNYALGEPYYLIDNNHNATILYFELQDKLIDNIVSKE